MQPDMIRPLLLICSACVCAQPLAAQSVAPGAPIPPINTSRPAAAPLPVREKPAPAAAAENLRLIPLSREEALALRDRMAERYVELCIGVHDRASADAAAAEFTVCRSLMVSLSAYVGQSRVSVPPALSERFSRAAAQLQAARQARFYGSRLMTAALSREMLADLPLPTPQERSEALAAFAREQAQAAVLLRSVHDKASADAAALDYARAQAHVNLLATAGLFEGDFTTSLVDYHATAAADVQRIASARFFGSSLLSELLVPRNSPLPRWNMSTPTGSPR